MGPRTPSPSETKDRFIVRFPDGLRTKLDAAAERNSRSMNSEIIARLEWTLRNEEAFHATSTGGIKALPEDEGLALEKRICALEQSSLILLGAIADLEDRLKKAEEH